VSWSYKSRYRNQVGTDVIVEQTAVAVVTVSPVLARRQVVVDQARDVCSAPDGGGKADIRIGSNVS